MNVGKLIPRKSGKMSLDSPTPTTNRRQRDTSPLDKKKKKKVTKEEPRLKT